MHVLIVNPASVGSRLPRVFEAKVNDIVAVKAAVTEYHAEMLKRLNGRALLTEFVSRGGKASKDQAILHQLDEISIRRGDCARDESLNLLNSVLYSIILEL